MTNTKRADTYIYYGLPICILFAVLLTSLVSHSLKNDLRTQFKKIEFVVDSNVDFDAELYYTYGTVFNATQKLEDTGTSKDTLVFSFPKEGKIIKKFRLDFGNDLRLKKVNIKSIRFLFDERSVILEEKEAFNSLFLHSASVHLEKEPLSIEIRKDHDPFDPYVIFSPLGAITMPWALYLSALLLPFLLLLCICCVRSEKPYKISVLDFLVVLFIICVPLKIAWTTFCALLLCIYGIVKAIRQRKVRVRNSSFYVYAGLFCALMLLGRPSGLEQIDKYLALVLFAIVGLTISFPKLKALRQYVYFMAFFNGILVTAGISFLLWFDEFYGLKISDYFKDIKIYSGHVRDWLYYDHAAFLSFFGLVGMLFAHILYQKKIIGKNFLYLYHILLLFFIILVGARICFLVYAVLLINILIKWSVKRSLALNSLFFIIVGSTLVYNIQNIDENRYYLWSVSWEAIKERPLFGYGLGKSNEVLHNVEFINKAGFAEAMDLNHSHNQFITFFLELGLVGFLAIVGILVYFLYKTEQYKNTPLVLLLIAMGYMFLTESILETSKPIYVICFLFLLLSMPQCPGSENRLNTETRK